MTSELNLSRECGNDTMSLVMKAIEGPAEDALALLNQSLANWPFDYRLWFLRGAALASQQRHDEARLDFLRVHELAPEFHMATFMLGFLDFINARGTAAEATWAVLDQIAEDQPLRVLKDGLLSLSRGDLEVSLRQLDRGLALNQQYPLINSYIQAVIMRITEHSQQSTATTADTQAPQGHLLLSGYQGNQTRH
jgi:tetratricopeptide (TPR) repeat protein